MKIMSSFMLIVSLSILGCNSAQSRNLALAEQTQEKSWMDHQGIQYRVFKKEGEYKGVKSTQVDNLVVVMQEKSFSKADYGYAVYLMQNLEAIERRPEVIKETEQATVTHERENITIKETEKRTVTTRDIAKKPQMDVHRMVLDTLFD